MVIQECLGRVEQSVSPDEQKFTVFIDEDTESFFLSADGVRSSEIVPMTAGEVLNLLSTKLDTLSCYDSIIVNRVNI